MDIAYFIGIDVGTQGARVVLLDEKGHIAGSQQTGFELTADSRQEQDPAVWWRAVLSGLTEIIKESKLKKIDLKSIKGVSVTSTSGTVIALDSEHRPIHPALMYSDDRSEKAGRLCKEISTRYLPHGYHGFNSSSGLSKMVWFVQTFPEKTPRLAYFAHATDFIIGQLSGKWNLTDETNVLKSGYDLQSGCWPHYLTHHLPLKASWLPEVVPAGTPIGVLDEGVALQIGLAPELAASITVTAGMTDGCASQVASGAVQPGTWNTTIGTTLVIKGVTKAPIDDPLDRLYNHRHPEGYWMPGGASNTGADWITTLFAGDQLEILERAAARLIPSGRLTYPLLKKGERFPFKALEATGFGLESFLNGQKEEPALLYAAGMEGVAYVEKMAFQLIHKLSNETIDRVYTAGGGSNSPTWLRIRSAVLQLPVIKMENASGAVGAAMLAASKTYYTSLSEAVSKMARVASEYIPDPALVPAYEQGYLKFIRTLAEKGYIHEEDYLI